MMKPLVFAVALFLPSMSLLSPIEAKSVSEYTIINTGIKAGGCWYDDSHFVIVKGKQSAPGQDFEVEGLYYLDPAKYQELKQVNLFSMEPALQRQIKEVTCQDETILFYVMAPDQKTSRLYSVKIGQQPELIADLRWARPSSVSIEGQYVLGNKLTVDKGVWEEHSDCNLNSLNSGLKALCWPRDTIPQWVTPQFVVSEYLWRASILVRDKDGKSRRILNPKSPLKLPDGTELKQGYLLRDLENRIVAEIPIKQGLYQLINVSFTSDPSGQYLYSVCFKIGDHGDRHFTVGGRICRFLLDGKNHDWEEVVSVQQSPNDPYSLHDLSVNAQGDVVMIERGHPPAISLWRYTAQSKRVEKLTHVVSPDVLGAPQVSPNGRWVSVVRQSQLILIESKGVKP
jgi:hypothetical protein